MSVSDWLYKNIVSIVLSAITFLAFLFTIFYQLKKNIERSRKNELELGEAKEKLHELELNVLELSLSCKALKEGSDRHESDINHIRSGKQ